MIKRSFCIIVVLLLTACTPQQTFEDGQREYVAGNYITAANIFSQYNTYSSDVRYEAMYYEGLCMYEIKNYKRANKLLTGVIEHSHNRKIKAQAIDVKAEMMLKTGDCLAATSLYRMLYMGYNDVYPQDSAFQKMNSVDALCGNSENIDEVSDSLILQPETGVVGYSTTTLKRVRIDTQFTEKEESLAVMNTLKDAGIESTLIRVQTPDNSHYIVQVGAFGSNENATARAIEVKNLGWKVVIVE